MRYLEVGGARVSVVGLGTWQFGSFEWGYGREFVEHTAPALVHRALDLGINLIDTAEIYGFGRSERVVGQAIRDRRDEAFVATKVFPLAPLAPVVERRGRASARRLGVETIDLYQVHWPNPVVPLGTTMAGMRRLVDEGIVHHVGVSNFSLGHWREADRALGGEVLSNQVRFNLVDRRPAEHLVPFAVESSRLVIAYSPLAQGLLGGRYDASNPPRGMARSQPLFLPGNLERAQPLIDALRRTATAYDAKPAQVALAWVLRRANTVVIPGASSVEQLESNAAAADLELTDEQDRELTEAAEAFEPVAGVSGLLGMAAELPRRVVAGVRGRLGL